MTSILLYGLAVVFIGQGVASLQEAGGVRDFCDHVPTIVMLGLFPTVQSISAQLVLLCLRGWRFLCLAAASRRSRCRRGAGAGRVRLESRRRAQRRAARPYITSSTSVLSFSASPAREIRSSCTHRRLDRRDRAQPHAPERDAQILRAIEQVLEPRLDDRGRFPPPDARSSASDSARSELASA